MPTGGGGGSGNVKTNSTITGNGSGASPLGVSGWPLAFFTNSSIANGIAGAANNDVWITGFVLPYPVTFAHIGINISVADNAHNYDFGIYSQAGILLANIGAQTLPSTGDQSFATVQGSQTLAPALYLFAETGTAVLASFGTNNIFDSWVNNTNVATSVGGALPASVTAQVVNPFRANSIYFYLF